MQRISRTSVLACWLLLQVLYVESKLNLIYHYDVESIDGKVAELLCKIDTDKLVKQVVWYRVSDNSIKQPIYYFEPPKFNATAPAYKNRVRLAADQSSLVFVAVGKEDEGTYECHVQVASNTSNTIDEIPEERNERMKLAVHIPPKAVKLTSFAASNKNMTLTCRSMGSKPQADVFWLVKRANEVKEYRSAKIVTEYQGDLADTIGYFYISLSHKDQDATIICMVDHPETQTKLRDNVTMVAPSLLHPVMMHFDWLGGEVPYAAFNPSDEEASTPSSGKVEMVVSPSHKVEGNTSVVITVSSKGAFPEPRYTWWSEDLDLRSGRVIRIDTIRRTQQLFCLVENPVGRVVVSVQLTVEGAEPGSTDSDARAPGDVTASGVMIMAIVFGTLVLVLVAAFLVYYCAFKPGKEEEGKADLNEANDFDSYVAKQKLPDSDLQPTGQAKISTYHVEPELLSSNEKQALLKASMDSLTPPAKHKEEDAISGKTSSTTTSGYGGDLGGSNGMEDNGRSPSVANKRAISQHLQDFDENASFVGDYGSSFGIDEIPKHCDDSSESSPHSSASDRESYDSGASGIEGRYALPPEESWENIDPGQVVLPQHRPTDI